MKRVLSLIMVFAILLSVVSPAYAAEVPASEETSHEGHGHEETVIESTEEATTAATEEATEATTEGGEEEKAEKVFDTTYTASNPLKAGTYELTLSENAVHTLYVFAPGEIGVYTITVNEGATVGYWGAGTHYVSNPNSTAASIEREIKSAGQAAVIGISSENANVTLTIEKTGESAGIVEKTYIDWENQHTPDANVVIPGGLVDIDIKEAYSVRLWNDGFYHLDGPNGPILYVDLNNSEFNLSNAYGAYGANSMKGNYNGTDYDFKAAMQAYEAVVATTGGLYPVTEDLYAFITAYGANQFWFDESKSCFSEITAGGFNPSSAWMVMCSYVPVDTTGTIDDPEELTLGETVVTFDGSETDLHYFYFTAPEAGTLTFTVSGDNWQYQYDYSMYDFDYCPDENSQTVELEAGEIVNLAVATFNPDDMWVFPAGTVTINAEFAAAAHEHSLTLVETKRATCTENGVQEHYACACGAIFADAEGTEPLTAEEITILATGHVRPVLVEAKRATCTEPGNYEYYLCNACSAYLLKDEANEGWVEVTREEIIILPIGHERPELIEAKRATCTEAGNCEYYLCGVCGSYLIKNEETQEWEIVTREDIVILPMGHPRPEKVEAKRATCTEAGNIEYYVCGACGNYLLKNNETQEWEIVTREDIVILAIGHERPELIEAKRATCTEAGNYEYYLCGSCGAYLIKDEENQQWVEVTREDIVILPTGHERPEKIDASVPSCTEAGNVEYYLCGGCGEYLIKDDENQQWIVVTREDVVILAMGHQRPQKFEAKRATCTEAGNYEYYLCNACGAYLLKDDANQTWVEVTREDIVILAIGHERPEKIEAKRATCTEPGNIEYYLCGACGAYLLKDEETQQWVEVTREDIIVLPIVHERPEKIEAKRATCDEPGNIEYYLCGACGNYLLKDEENQVWEIVTREDIIILPIGHQRPELIEAKRATCTEGGNIEYYLCGVCGKYLLKDEETQQWVEVTREDIVILPIGHERPELIEAVPATCTEMGNIEYYLCGACGEYLLKDNENQTWETVTREEILILPMGHIRAEKHAAVRPTCTEDGNIEYWYCPTCDAYFTERTPNGEQLEDGEWILLATGHQRPELIEAKKPTCTEAGNYEYYLCGGCGKYLLKDNENQTWIETTREDILILPLGHERPEKVEASADSCTGEGTVDYYYCSVCENYLIKDEENQQWIEVSAEDLEILTNGHANPQKFEAKMPTCTENGNYEYYYCNACGAYLMKDESGAWVAVTVEDVTILAIGHQRPELIEAKRATCDEPGNIEYYLCNVCGGYLLKDEENQTWTEVTREDILILPIGHDRPEKIEAKRPTCTEAGNYEYYLCGVCGKYLVKDDENQQWITVTREDIVILALGHQRPEKVEAKRATCDEPGNIEYYLCGVCGAYLLKDDENQTWTEVTREEVIILPIVHERPELIEAKRATCTEPGNIEYYLCGVCGKYLLKDNENQVWIEVTREEILILPIGHQRPEKFEAKRATCTEAGNYEYYLCGVCGEYLQKDEENQQWITVAREDIVILPIGHQRPEKFEAKRATCTEAGNYEYYLCGVCGEYLIKNEETQEWEIVTREDIVILPIGHDRPEKIEAKRATCTEPGNIEYYLCGVCGNYLLKNDETQEWQIVVREDIIILPIGHERPEKIEAVPATCTEPGNIEYFVCGVCGEYLLKNDETQEWEIVTREDVIILPMGHIRAEKHEAVRPTCTEPGNIEYWYCPTCDGYYTDRTANGEKLEEGEWILLPMGHDRPEKIEAKRATCTEPGNIEYYLCGVCGKYLLKDEENQEWIEVTREDIIILPLGHERPELIEAKAPTCTEMGNIEYFLCGVCGNYLLKNNETQEWEIVTREDVILLPTGHIRAEKHEAVKPTCTEPGNIEYWYCGVCDGYYTDRTANGEKLEEGEWILLPMGHDRPELIEAKAPTCTEPGNIEYFLCGVCGNYLLKNDETQEWEIVTRFDIILLPIGHQRPEKIEAKRATCDEAGNIEYYLCGVCGEYLIKDEENQQWITVTREDVVILALGHERPELIEAKRATCTEPGNIEYYWCNACGKYLLKDEENQQWIEVTREDILVLPIGHERPEKIEAKRATCDEPGNIEYYLCGVCGEYLIKDEANQEWVIVDREYILILPMGHDRPELIEAKRATCTEAGNIEYYLCGVCGKYLLKDNENQQWVEVTREDIVILPIGHERPELIEAVPATCTEMGNIEYYLCGACGEYLLKDNENQTWETVTREEILILPMGHIRAEKHAAVRPTCTEDGNIEYWYCPTCDGYYTERTPNGEKLEEGEWILLAMGHDRPELIEAKKPTCTEAGNYEYYLCGVCGKYLQKDEENQTWVEVTREDILILPLGHERPEKVEASADSCTGEGTVDYYYCAVCENYLIKDEENQQWIEVSAEDLEILTNGHANPQKFEAKMPTCTENGNYEYYYCNACGAYLMKDESGAWVAVTVEDVTILAIGHQRPEKIEAKRATCDEPGNIEYYLCNVCGGYLLKDEENQTWVEVTREDILILPIGHERPEKIEAKRPTCTEAGNYEYYLCGVCGKYLVKDDENQQWITVTREDIVILPLGHQRPEKVEAKRATCDEPGNIEYYLCNVCGAYMLKDEENQQWVEVTREDILILPIGHQRPEKIEAKRATCTEPGNIEYYLCGVCGKYLLKDNENQQWVEVTREEILILPLGHQRPEKFDAKRATCTEAGNIEYFVCGVCGEYMIKDNETQQWIIVEREDVVILALGHERPELIEAKRATCTEPGNIEYYWCGACGGYLLKDDENQQWIEVTREDIIILPIGHDRPEKIEAKRATCTEAGNIEYYLCGVCGEYLIKDNENQQWIVVDREYVVILPIGHIRPEKIEAKRATCTEAGNIEYYLCGGCGEYLIKDEESQQWIVVDREYVVILPMGHLRPEKIEAKRATCTEAGNIEYYLCGVCGGYLLKDEETQQWIEVTREDVVILATGHDRPELIEAKRATCTEPGNIEYFLCGACGMYLLKDDENQQWVEVSREDILVLPLGHQRVEKIDAKAPTCGEPGNIEYYLCGVCGGYLLKDNENQQWVEVTREDILLLPLGHEAATITIPAKAPTDTEPGNKSFKVTACTICGTWLDKNGNEMSEEEIAAIWAKYTIYPDTREIAVLLNGENVAGSKLTWDMNCQETTITLTTEHAPVAAQPDVTWTTSSKSIATVEDGVVTFKKPGTVKITAKANDGSGVKSVVEFTVIYIDAAKKFTASLEETTNLYGTASKSGVQVGDSVNINVFGSNKEVALEGLSYQITSGANYAELDGNTLTALVAGKTVKVKAFFEGDPLKRSVTISIKTIATKPGSMELTYGEAAELDEYGCIITDGMVGETLMVKSGAAKTFDLSLTAYDQLGLNLDDYGTITWSTSSTKLATVKNGVVTVKKGVSGTVTITAKSSLDKNVTAKLVIDVVDYTPAVADATLSINTYLTGSFDLGIIAEEANPVTGVKFVDSKGVEIDKFAIEQIDGVWSIADPGEALKNATTKGKLILTTRLGEEEITFSVTVANKAPTVTVKTTKKLNTKDPNGYAELTVTSKQGAIAGIELTSVTFDWAETETNGVYKLTPNNGDAKLDKSGKITVLVEGYRYEVTKTLSVASESVKNKAVLENKTITLSLTDLEAASTGITTYFEGVEVKDCTISTTNAQGKKLVVTFADGVITADFDAENLPKAGSYKFTVKATADDGTALANVTLTIKVVK